MRQPDKNRYLGAIQHIESNEVCFQEDEFEITVVAEILEREEARFFPDDRYEEVADLLRRMGRTHRPLLPPPPDAASFPNYAPGSWGPAAADGLLAGDGSVRAARRAGNVHRHGDPVTRGLLPLPADVPRHPVGAANDPAGYEVGPSREAA